jgi:hypothetical protein
MAIVRSALAILSLSGLCAAGAGHAQAPDNRSPYYTCVVFEKQGGGTWRASREMTDNGGAVTASGDIYEWEVDEPVKLASGTTLNWYARYRWPKDSAEQKKIAGTDILVDLHFGFSAKSGVIYQKPDKGWFHLYRSVDPEKDRHPFTTSLTTLTYWHQYGSDRFSAQAGLSVDNLLAFGSGYDSLAWDIRLPPDANGNGKVVAKGMLPIAAMRDHASSILKLRKLVDKKAANFRKSCNIVPMVPVSVRP